MKHTISLIGFILFFNTLLAQEQTLLTIDNRAISDEEFIRIYQKNNNEVNAVDKKTVSEYLDLFINFKLKVIEAENRGMDTLSKFQKELNGYKHQLERPYFTDKITDDRMLKEAFERQQTDVRASHILIMCTPDASPKDSLAAYRKIANLRQQIIDGKISFAQAAQQKSEDPSAKQNKGDLGYFTVFQMVYPFENAAYNTPVGQISEIVKTRYGYHILKITDKRQSKGEVKVAHIMVGMPKDAQKEAIEKSEEKIKMIYHKLKGGADFKELAQLYSDDKASAQNGGELNWFGTNQMVRPFEDVAYALKTKGEFSKPVRTRFGWHIIKLLDKKEPKSFQESENWLKRTIASDMRSRVSKKAVYDRIKKAYHYELNAIALDDFYQQVDTSIFSGKWDKNRLSKLNKPLFTLNGSEYNQQTFVEFLGKNTKYSRPKTTVKQFIDRMFMLFEEQELKNIERVHLSEKYPDYRYLLQEYHDGILLFDLTDQEVWTKAIEDSIGMGHFYDTHKANYQWGQRVEASVYEYKNAKTLKKLKKAIKKQIKKGYSQDQLLTIVNKKEDNAVELIKSDVFSKGSYKMVDLANEQLQFFEKTSKTPLYFTQNNKLVAVTRIIPQTPKKLDEAKGQIIADYQDYLEKEWIKRLRQKYPVTLNEAVWESVKAKF